MTDAMPKQSGDVDHATISPIGEAVIDAVQNGRAFEGRADPARWLTNSARELLLRGETGRGVSCDHDSSLF
jgi:hypothetical protein